MNEVLRKRGVAVLGALVGNGDMAAVSDAKAWEREVVALYPSLEVITPYSTAERQFAEEHVRLRKPKFTLATGSTYMLTEGDLEAVINTVAVRLHRLAHGKPARKTGPKGVDLEAQILEAARLRREDQDNMPRVKAARLAVERLGRGGCQSDKAAIDTIRKDPRLG